MSDLDVIGDDLTVALPGGSTVRFAHLDYAASAPAARVAFEAVRDALPAYGSVHRGAGARSIASTAAYEQARAAVGAFVGARPGDHVIFTRNTTDALNLLARALPPNTATVIFEGEHHANLLPWPHPVRLPVTGDPVTALAEALTGLTGRPVLVSVTGASNVTGEIWPIRELADVAHAHGARLLVDAAQLAPHAPVDLDTLGADYLALSGHKLYAPFGAGVLAGRADWLDAAPPYLAGGGATQAVGDRPGEVIWNEGPARHEAGTPNLPGAVALAAVCTALTAADRDELHEQEQKLVARLRDGVARIPGATEVSIFGPDHPRVGILSIVLADHDPAEVADRLGDEYGVGVRAGLFCAHPLSRRLASGHGRLLRASVGLGSTEDDVDRFLTGLAEVIAAR